MNNANVKFVNFDSADVIATSAKYALGSTLNALDYAYRQASANGWSGGAPSGGYIDVLGADGSTLLEQAKYYQLISAEVGGLVDLADPVPTTYTWYNLTVSQTPAANTPADKDITDVMTWIQQYLAQ